MCVCACMCIMFFQYGIEDLKAEPSQTACWDGVRNYQVRPATCDFIMVYHKKDLYKKRCILYHFLEYIDLNSEI